ncbi:MAG: NAD-dependent epimerase/dehydratase family protein [Thermomicrobiales bacterium]
MATDEKRSILLTGAAGRIGTAFYDEFRDDYRFHLTDRDEGLLSRPLAPEDSAAVINIADFSACAAACAGIDTVVHLAADPSPEADFDASLLENNIQGTYNIFRAALEAGCRRVIFASSIHAVLGYPLAAPIPEDAPVWPVNMYGVSKCFGEATARKFATDGLSSIAIRIGAYDAPWHSAEMGEGLISVWVSKRDLNQLIHRCVELEGVDFAIVHGESNNARKRLSLDETIKLTGYQPVDDGFERFR